MNPTTGFAGAVYTVAAQIPKGKVATYGQLARLAGNPNAARAVGMLMSRNKNMRKVPCHRVVASDGALTGYAFGNGVITKREMLEREGVGFRGARVLLPAYQWSA